MTEEEEKALTAGTGVERVVHGGHVRCRVVRVCRLLVRVVRRA